MSERDIGFRQIAEAVAEHLGGALDVPIRVVDDREIIIAASDPGQVGQPLPDEPPDASIRVPVPMDGHRATVIIGQPAGEVVAPRLVATVVRLIASRTRGAGSLPSLYELRNTLIHDLLGGRLTDEASIYEQSQILGISLLRPRVVCLLDAGDYLEGPPTPS
ncbi:MAG TPA: hypothetical protein VKY74_05090, partial [Chloroflexia bacterium]|nr:hypothetical protein [Chloroflexia bacterium]